MKRHMLLFCWLIAGGLQLQTFSVSAEQTNETSVLFIGNSFTHYNGLPSMITTLAKSGGHNLVCQSVTPGGSTFEQHWKDGKAVGAIHARKWDFVVLQEHSMRPVDAKDLMFEYGQKLNTEIKDQGAETLLYLTWAWPKPDKQPVITAAYQELAKKLNATVVPVGIVWSTVLHEHPEIGLFAEDNHHPSPTGTYLAACAFYASIYGSSPEGLTANVKGVKEAEAVLIQKMTASVIQNSSNGDSSAEGNCAQGQIEKVEIKTANQSSEPTCITLVE